MSGQERQELGQAHLRVTLFQTYEPLGGSFRHSQTDEAWSSTSAQKAGNLRPDCQNRISERAARAGVRRRLSDGLPRDLV